MAIHPNFDFAFFRLADINYNIFDPYFDALPYDPYVDGKFRQRRFSRVHFDGEKVTLLPHKVFVQSSDVNRLAGDVKRDFDEIDDSLLQATPLAKLLAAFCEYSGVDGTTTELGIHQIRILCGPGISGMPAPEGIHQDGFDFVGIFCVMRHNLKGALTELYGDPHEDPIFASAVRRGDFVLANDRKVYHYTTPLTAIPGEPGHRDVFVVTA